MDQTQLSALLFLCDVRSRLLRLQVTHGGYGSSTFMAELKEFHDNVEKYNANKIKKSTFTKRGTSFLARFPDLQLRFWRLISDPRADVCDAPALVTTTGAFARLESHLVWQHILLALPHPTAARLGVCCKWLRRMVTPRLLIRLRQPWEARQSVPIVGGGAPLRLGTADGQEVALYIINDTMRLLGMKYEGRYYVLDTNSVEDPLRINWKATRGMFITLFELLNNIAKAPAGVPLDLRMWARIAPLSAVMMSVEITAHGEFDPIARTYCEEGVKYKFPARGNRMFWGPLVE